MYGIRRRTNLTFYLGLDQCRLLKEGHLVKGLVLGDDQFVEAAHLTLSNNIGVTNAFSEWCISFEQEGLQKLLDKGSYGYKIETKTEIYRLNLVIEREGLDTASKKELGDIKFRIRELSEV
ncbi:hypothetical protein HY498_05930 [Candidatus Woesearchaeota archaeon]|nr:hypothetical protein [Candidatus Woesearchaeota archaeon]